MTEIQALRSLADALERLEKIHSNRRSSALDAARPREQQWQRDRDREIDRAQERVAFERRRLADAQR